VAREPGPGPKSDLGWEIRPAGLLALLREARARYHLPIYVTENGIADEADSRRPAFLRAHLRAIAAALADGVLVRGYFHWSLLDNFEWADGFSPRFGLYAVNYATLARVPRPSVATFRALTREIGAEPPP
jgi:beta-glucosidase/6-phospho-beta-glucosidase/beta-galactosidase